MTEPKSPWDRDETTQPSVIAKEEQILGSEMNKLDAKTHPLRDSDTPPYGTEIPPEIIKAVRRERQETATGGIPSLTIAEIAAQERARHRPDTPDAAILRRPTKK